MRYVPLFFFKDVLQINISTNILNFQIKMEKAAKQKGKAPLPATMKPS